MASARESHPAFICWVATFTHLFLGALTTFPENVIKIFNFLTNEQQQLSQHCIGGLNKPKSLNVTIKSEAFNKTAYNKPNARHSPTC